MNLNVFWNVTKRSYQRFLSYRSATLAGIVTNFFFGILRAAILVALYGEQTQVEGITLQSAITYAAITQALIGYISLFGWYDLMTTVYTGEVGVDLLKPMSYLSFWLAKDFGRAIVQFIFRGVTILAGYALIFNLTWPARIEQWLAFSVAILISWALSFLFRFSINLCAFWTPNATGILRLFYMASWFFTGFLMPLRFFPEWLQSISYLTPFPHMLTTVIEIYLGVLRGPEMWLAIGYQLIWVIILFLIAKLTLRAGVRRLVILGG